MWIANLATSSIRGILDWFAQTSGGKVERLLFLLCVFCGMGLAQADRVYQQTNLVIQCDCKRGDSVCSSFVKAITHWHAGRQYKWVFRIHCETKRKNDRTRFYGANEGLLIVYSHTVNDTESTDEAINNFIKGLP